MVHLKRSKVWQLTQLHITKKLSSIFFLLMPRQGGGGGDPPPFPAPSGAEPNRVPPPGTDGLGRRLAVTSHPRPCLWGPYTEGIDYYPRGV